MAKFLDQNGLLYFWSKIKAIIPTRTSQITNDSGFITSSDLPEGAAASNTSPKMDGTANVGSEMAFARGDHVHPSDTTKVDKVTGKGLSTNDLTDTLKSNYDAAYTHSQSAHAPSTAEKNIIVGIQKNGTDLTVNSSTRKVNITVPTKTSDITNDSGFITAEDVPDAYTLPVASSTALGGVKSGTDITVDGSGNVSVIDDSHTHTVAKITDITASATEINYVKGVTSSVQTQIDGKVPTSRTVNGKALSSNITLSASDVSAIPTSQKGTASGVCPLNSSGKIDDTYLPSYVDDVIEGYYYNSKFYKESAHTTEITGETGKIYLDIATDKTYRYGGTAFVEITSGSMTVITNAEIDTILAS